MSIRDRRKVAREARRAVLTAVAAAPTFKTPRGRTRRAGRSPLRRGLIAAFAVAVLAAVVGSPRFANAGGPPTVPELDPGSMAGALTLLAGGVLALTDRIRRA